MNIYAFSTYENFVADLAKDHNNDPHAVMQDLFYVNREQWKLGKAEYDSLRDIIAKIEQRL